MESKTIKLLCNDNKEVVFDAKLIQFSKVLSEGDESTLEFPCPFDEDIVLIMKKFLESHNYDMNSVKVKKPIKSNKLEEGLDEISYNIFRQYSDQLYTLEQVNAMIKSEQEVNEIKQQSSITEEERLPVAKLLDLSSFLDFKLFMDVILMIFAAKYFIGSTEEELKKYMEDNNIPEPTFQQNREILDEYREVFDRQNEEFAKQFEDEAKNQQDNANQQQ